MKLGILSFASFAFLVGACSGAAPADVETPSDSESSELRTGLCKESACGPAPMMSAERCSDGSIGGSTGRCVRDQGKCHWEIRHCPPEPPVTPPPVPPPTPVPVDCSAEGACGPALGMPTQLCEDGTEAGPICVDKGGVCGWEITTCPTPKGTACGKNVCTSSQICCDGIPFNVPTCVNGPLCPL